MAWTNGSLDETARRRLLAAVGRTVPHAGVPVMNAQLLDAAVDLLVVVDANEHARRRAAGAGAFADWDVLVTMMSLPRWEPVALWSLTGEERGMVHRAPPGAVQQNSDGTVTRLAGPPVSSVLAVVTDADWDRGLNVASRFAPVATRVLVLADEPSDLAVAAAEAAEYGIGLGVAAPDGVRLVVAAERWQERYFAAGGWLFREQVYRAYLRAVAVSERAVDTV